MSVDGIVKKMTGLGFKDYGWDNSIGHEICRAFGKRCMNGSPNCDSNEKVPELIAKVYFFPSRDDRGQKIGFEVCGQSGNLWIYPKIYSVDLDDVERVLPVVEKAMEAMWKVGYEVIEEYLEVL